MKKKNAAALMAAAMAASLLVGCGGKDAAQSSAASGYQDSPHSLFSPKSYQENKKDTWRSSVFSPAVFDNAPPCGIITVL